MKQSWWRVGLVTALILGGTVGRPAAVRAEEELAVEEDAPAPAADAAVTPAAPATKAAPAAKPRAAGATIATVTVVPVDGQTEIRVAGKGKLVPHIWKKESKIVLDFAGARYAAPIVPLGPPGLGDIHLVRGAQNKGFARVVVELTTMVGYTVASKAGSFTLTLATQGVAGPDAADAMAAPAPVATASPAGAAAASAAAFPSNPGATEAMDGGTGRARVLHAMVTDLPDRARLVVTADGMLRYKLASLADGRELQLSLFDVDLKWSPPHVVLKDGPITDVRADQVTNPAAQVRVTVKLRTARPYHVRRDQNQVILEVEKESEAESAAADTGMHKGDLMHKVTLNVQNEDMPSLVKALAFEAGFENVILPVTPVSRLVTLSLREVTFAKALNLVLAPFELVWKVDAGVLRVDQQTVFEKEIETVALSGGGSGDSGKSSDAAGGYETRVFHLRNASLAFFPVGTPSVVVQAVQFALLVKNSRTGIQTDPRTNSLIVTDVASNMGKIASIIRQLDIKVPQVMIQARLVSLNRNSTNQFGINWNAERATPANPTVNAHSTGSGKGEYTLKTGFLGPGFNLEATLDMLQTKGDIETLLNPSIATLHDQTATVGSVRTLNYDQNIVIHTPTGDVPGTQQASVTVPTTLTVRPHVNADGTISISVIIELTSVVDENAKPPSTDRQNASTALVVRNHETGVIGGILRDSKSKTIRKVPLLGDLPWFLGGALFRTTTDSVVKQELVLFLTPTIQDDI